MEHHAYHAGDAVTPSSRKHFDDHKFRIRECLDIIQTEDHFAHRVVYKQFPNPGLQIGGNKISFPLQDRDVSIIRNHCQPAPLGIGNSTVVDLAVRKTWEISYAEITLANPAWKEWMETTVVPGVKAGLGV
jgi:hypothetical protein